MRLLTLCLLITLLGAHQSPAQEPTFLGVRVGDLSKEDAQKLGWDAPRGAKLVQTVPGGPAAAAGLQPGDIILSLDDVDIGNYRQFLAVLHTKSAGAEIHLRLLRNGKEMPATMKLMNSAEALSELGRAIAQNANAVESYISRSELLFRLGRAADAAPDCDQIIRLSPQNGVGNYCRARVLLAQDKLDAALEDLNIAVQKLTRSERPLLTRALLHEKKKDYDSAIADLNRALAINERDAVALTMRGEAYLAKALLDRAIEDFNAALAIDKSSERAKRGLISARAKQNEVIGPEPAAVPGPATVTVTPPSAPASLPQQTPPPDAAKKVGQDSITIDPKLKVEISQLQAKKDFKQALELIDKSLAATPTHAGLRNLRGSVLQLSGDYAKAITEYDQAASLQPKFAEAHANRINARLALRKTDDALKAAEEFVQESQGAALAYDLRGKARLQANKSAEAQADFEQALAKDPKLATAWLGRGQIYLLNKDYDKAQSDFARAIELDPKSDNAYSFRGKARLMQKDMSAAIADFRKSLSLNGANWVAFTSLQALQVTKALQQLGQVKKDGS